ncbi:related to MFS amino acid transporter [Lecanosticta acicola]|uniref:Related to MFS amino acid transporter n=1 Tax=Lecanosticta acicola TaxID=111012 RepID=A0AAI8Z2J4_9PEZI|nr:related to MFS amino acid transporter [Lecanosticta acicola]
MAMYERRGSLESFDRFRSASPTGSERRKLSFNPLAEWTPPVQGQPSAGAFEVSKGKRIAQVICAVIYCLLAAGIVFGFAAIKPVFVAEGVYKDKCTQKELEEGVWVCYEQELRLNLMFTVAAVSTNVCALPVGTVLDKYGPRVASIVGVVFLTVGALLLAFAKDIPGDAYIPGYLFLALGGPFVFIPSFQLSNTFPQNSGLILALLTGAFDTSSAIFLIYRLIYEATDGSFDTRKFFLVYLVVPAFVLLAQIFVMPSKSYKSVGELVAQVEEAEQTVQDSHEDISGEEQQNGLQGPRRDVVGEVTSLLGTKKGEDQTKTHEDSADKSGVWGALHGKTSLQQILTPWWLLITLFTMIQMLRINYFVATIRTQYTDMLGSEHEARRINEIFDVALPLGGVVAIPFVGLVLDHTSTPFVLGLLVSIATAIGIFGLIPETWAAYINIILFVIYRPFYYTAVSDYSAKVFGFQTFGKVYGLIICIAGLFNFAQAGLDALRNKVFHNDPIPVNAILLALALLVGIVMVGYVWRKSVTLEKERLREEADAAQERLIPGADAAEVNRPHGHETYGTA